MFINEVYSDFCSLCHELKKWYDNLTNSAINLIFIAVSWIAILFIISPVAGIPWADFDTTNTREIMYYHAMVLPLIGILILLVCCIMEIQGHVNTLLRYSLIPVIILNGVGGMFIYSLNDVIPLWTQILGFLVLDEMGVALIYGLAVLPRKNGVGYKNMHFGYWVVFSSVVSAFIAAAFLGHVAGMTLDWGSDWFWIIPGLGSYLNGQGLDTATFLSNLVGSHSHEIVPAVMGGTVSLAMIQFGYADTKGIKHGIALLGLAIMEIGIILMTIIYIIGGVTNYVIPAIFTSPDGVNGLALDDALTALIGIGAMVGIVALAPIRMTKSNTDKSLLLVRDPLRLTVLLSWICAFIAVGVFGIYIEFNESFYGAGDPTTLAPGVQADLAFSRAHLMLGFFMMPILAGALLALDIVYRKNPTMQYPKYVAPLGITGMVISLVGDVIWIDYLSYWIFFIGYGILVLTLIAIAYYLHDYYSKGAQLLPNSGAQKEVGA